MAEHVVLVVILTVLFYTANMFTWLLQTFDSAIREIPTFEQFRLSDYVKSIPSGLEFLPALAMFFIVNRFIPDRTVGSRVALISAVTSASLWWIAGKAFVWYLSAFHSFSKLYGTYAFILVLLTWIYYSSVVFIVGTIIGQLYRERRDGEK
jgi:YihY family inner membrane protein